jgi:hypothetical protein
MTRMPGSRGAVDHARRATALRNAPAEVPDATKAETPDA